jgi:hypothetical protein
MNPLPPDRRDDLLHDLYNGGAGTALATRMATRVRRKRRIRRAGTACVVIAILAIAGFQTLPRSPQNTPARTAAKIPAPAAAQPSPGYTAATDADLLAALKDERVIIFTLADGQRQVVWLSPRPNI